jgi:uncharacterized protein YlxP (DUF503 family)
LTIGLLQVEMLLLATHSLKDKRSVLSRIKNQVRNKFNVAIAELKYGDQWGRTLLGMTTISNDGKIVQQILDEVETFLESQFQVQILNRKVELF